MKNVLFISYYFPPIGGAGVQRIPARLEAVEEALFA